MLDQADIDNLKKYEPQYKRYQESQVFTGFGHDGIMAISNAYHKLTGQHAQVNCSICLIQATNIVYNQYYKQCNTQQKNFSKKK